MLFLSLRVVHMLMAATWLGATAILALIIIPADGDSLVAGGAVMAAVGKRGLVPLMAMLSGFTALTGLVLFWHFTQGFNPEISRSHAGMAFGTGGALGLLATILDGSLIGRAAKQLMALQAQAAAMPQGSERVALLQKMAAVRGRLQSSSRLVLGLIVLAMICMSVGHYV